MISALTTRLEIDVMQSNELATAMELTCVHKIPVLVVHPELVPEATMLRVRHQSQCKIFVPVDWPNGSQVAINKFIHMSTHAMSQDGFEIMLSEPKDVTQAIAETTTIISFVRDRLQLARVGIVLGAATRDDEMLLRFCEAAKHQPWADYIRTDCLTKMQQTKANLKEHQRRLEILASTNRIVKISGNVTLKILQNCTAKRFGVSVKQAIDIVAELKKAEENSTQNV